MIFLLRNNSNKRNTHRIRSNTSTFSSTIVNKSHTIKQSLTRNMNWPKRRHRQIQCETGILAPPETPAPHHESKRRLFFRKLLLKGKRRPPSIPFLGDDSNHHEKLRKELVPEDTASINSALDEATNKRQNSTSIATATSKTAASQEQSPIKQVRFSVVHIRRYQVILSDQPRITIPLGLGWNYIQEEPENIETYTTIHHEQNKDYLCAKDLLSLDIDERRAKLKSVGGYTEKRIQQEECRRKVVTAMEWAYRSGDRAAAAIADVPLTLDHPLRVIRRYIV